MDCKRAGTKDSAKSTPALEIARRNWQGCRIRMSRIYCIAVAQIKRLPHLQQEDMLQPLRQCISFRNTGCSNSAKR
jgi:hypothetical protein